MVAASDTPRSSGNQPAGAEQASASAHTAAAGQLLVLDVLHEPADLSCVASSDAVVIALDTVTAATSIACALDAGIQAVHVAADDEAARHLCERLAGRARLAPSMPTALYQAPHHGEDLVLVAPELARLLHAACGGDGLVLTGSIVNARPVAAAAALCLGRRQQLQIACAGHANRLAIDDSYTAGVLARLLLEELQRPAVLTDAAGVAVSIEPSYGSHLAALSASHAARALLTSGAGSEADLRLCGQQDLIGSVGAAHRSAGGDIVVTPLGAPQPDEAGEAPRKSDGG